MSKILEYDKEYVWHPFTALKTDWPMIPLESAKDEYLYTTEGTELIDAVSSWWVNVHGHGNEVLANVVKEQVLNLDHVIFAGFTHEPATTLAKNIIDLLPFDASKAFFTDDGSTAVEVAMKMAIQYLGINGKEKPLIFSLEGAYHGDTFGAMSANERSPFNQHFDSYLFDTRQLPLPSEENVDDICKVIDDHEGAGIFIFEPLIQGAAGMRMYDATHLDRIIKACHYKGIVCIADEVMTGFYRTGKLFAIEHLAYQPDIICLSKGITGGILPLGFTVASQKIVDAFDSPEIEKTLFHGHSYTGNAITCAVANASLKLLLSEETQKNIQRISNSHKDVLESFKSNEKVLDARCLGTVLAIELKSGETSYFNNLKYKVYEYFLDKGILMRPLGNVIYVFPPYCLSQKNLEYIYRNIEELLSTL